MLHGQDLPVPKPTEKWTIDDDENDDEPVPMEQYISDADFQPSTSNEPHLISQDELNDLVRDLKTYLRVKLNCWDHDCKAGTCCRRIQIFRSFVTGKKILLSILLRLVIWFSVQILIRSWLH
jgi:hypothetical protein